MAKIKSRVFQPTTKLNQETTMSQDTTKEEPIQSQAAPEVIDQGIQQEPTKEPEVVTPVVEKPAPVKTPVVEQKQVVQQTSFEQFLAVYENGTVQQKNLIAALQQYMEAMKPGKPITGEEGAKQQFKLWKIISNAIETSTQEEFKKLWGIILAFFQEFKDDVFHDRYVFRFSEYWHYSEQVLTAFQRILNLIKLTADSNQRRHGLKQVDLKRTLAEGFSDEGRQKIVSFYQP